MSLNRIYTGPPGTGKTFTAWQDALEIVSRNLNANLSTSAKMLRINQTLRTLYSTNEYKAKSNSIYRNGHALMWMAGFLLEERHISKSEEILLTKEMAITRGMPSGPSSWSQRSQFISQFRLVTDWKDTTSLMLNQDGKKFIEILEKNQYTITQLKSWNSQCPTEISAFYSEIISNQLRMGLTPVLKSIFGALHMALDEKLYRQDSENRKASQGEREIVSQYFDIRPESEDIKWIGHFAKILDDLGLVKCNTDSPVDGVYLYVLTPLGKQTVEKIIENWTRNYPELFSENISVELAIQLGFIEFITFHQSFSYEDFIEGIRPIMDSTELGYEIVDGIFKNIANRARNNPEQNYVMVIDEINRGNISKIFGELLTIIEDNKRIDPDSGEYPQFIRLPYSKDLFGVPKNLYVVATMNSADRSITNIDFALRRRFSFKNIQSNPLLCAVQIESNTGKSYSISDFLSKLNKKIDFLIDSNHHVGHSYFITVKDQEDFLDSIQNRIIPLLLEYFLGDLEKVALVLGESIESEKPQSQRFIKSVELDGTSLFKSVNNQLGEHVIYSRNSNLQAPISSVINIDTFFEYF